MDLLQKRLSLALDAREGGQFELLASSQPRLSPVFLFARVQHRNVA